MVALRTAILWLGSVATLAADALAPDLQRFERERGGAWEVLASDAAPPDTGQAVAWRLVAGAPQAAGYPLHVSLLDPRTGREVPMRWSAPRGRDDRLLLAGAGEDGDPRCEVLLIPRSNRLEIAGRLRAAGERSLHVRVELELDAAGGRWWDAPRRSREVDARLRYATTHAVPVGWRGQMSTYPFSCLATDRGALSFAVPLREPRVFEIAYDGPRRRYGVSFDLALSPLPLRLPGQATFAALLYAPDPAWGLRAAARDYYAFFPEDFTRRTDRDGVWMPFTRVNDVTDAEDFRFAFHEYGAVDLPWNRERGIYSLRYLEPMTYWMAMEADLTRDYPTAISQLVARARGPDAWNRAMAQATLGSAIQHADGRLSHQFVHEPWCSGTLFHNNSDPDVPPAQPGFTNAAEVALRIARDEVLGTPPPRARHWDPFGEGYVLTDAGEPRGRVVAVRSTAPGQTHGAVQRVVLNQAEARPLLLRGWSRAAAVGGPAGPDYALYADVTYTDGSHLWAQAAAFPPGTHDGAERQVFIQPERPVRDLAVLVLLRGAHTGEAWFDDVSLRELPAGATAEDAAARAADAPERLRNGDFEEDASAGQADGIYLDSLEGWAKRLNFRREHFRHVDLPLTYETGTARPAILNAFSIYEFTDAMARLLHREGRILMANWVLIDFPFYAALLDVPGKEVHWLDGQGRFAPDADDTLMYRRMLSARKPYPLLLNVHFDRFTPRMMEQYFQRSLFYAMAPGMFSHDAASHPYFEDPALYNRDRPLFMRYLPPLQRLSAAGWEPLTHAHADPPLLVERYGTRSGNGLFLAVHRDDDAPGRGRVRLDADALGLAPGAAAVELLGGRRVDLGADAAWDVSLGPYETAVYRLLNPGGADAAAWAREAAAAVRAAAQRYGRQGRLASNDVAALTSLAGTIEEGLATGGADAAIARLGTWRDRAAALPQPDLRWRIEEAQNACAAWQADRFGLKVELACPSSLVSPSSLTCAVTVVHGTGPALELAGLTLRTGDGRSRKAAAPASARALAPGQPRTLRVPLQVPAGLTPGAAWPVSIALDLAEVSEDGTAHPLTLVRHANARIVPPLEARLVPGQVRTFGGPARLRLDVQHNGPAPQELDVEARCAWTTDWTRASHTLSGGGPGAIEITVQPPAVVAPTSRELVLTLLAEGAERLAVTSRVTVFPPTRNLLARDGVRVQVDSSFGGYRPEPVHDGITDTRDLSWEDAAWASAEVASPHWVEALLPQAVTAAAIVVHWAEDGGTIQRSRQWRLEVFRDGAWMHLPAAEREERDGRATRLSFPPVTADRWRLWQPAGGGPVARPDLLWLDEWELLPPAPTE